MLVQKVNFIIKESSTSFPFNIQRILANQLTFIPPEIIRKP